MSRVRHFIGITAAAGVLLGVACVTRSADNTMDHMKHDHAAMMHMSAWDSVTSAVAVLHATKDQKAHGWVRFTQEGAKVKVVAHVEGLEPNSTHGFHIHEFGDCTSDDGSSAGGHYNPEGHKHAGPGTASRHAGDLGNIKADDKGVAQLEVTVDNISVAGMKDPIIGRAVIVHAKADDIKSQPTGDAGGRIACGVIGVAKAAAAAK
jgi:Cu-Zn family superoxide dismutase